MDSTIARKIVSKQVDLLYQGIPFSLVTAGCIIVLLFIFMHDFAQFSSLVIWGFLMVLVTGFRSMTTVFYFRDKKRQKIDSTSSHYYERIFLVGVALSGLLWASMGCYFYPLATYPQRYILFTMLVGMSAGSITTLGHRIVPSFYMIFAILLPLQLGIYLVGGDHAFTIIFGLSIYLFFLLKTSSFLYRNNRELLQLKEESILREQQLQKTKRLVDKERRQHKLILDTTGDGIYGVNTEGIINFMNVAALRITGYQMEEVIGRNQHDILFHATQDQTFSPPVQKQQYRCMEKCRTHRFSGKFFRRKDGTKFSVDYTCSPTMENDIATGAVITFTDTSERRKAENALRESEEKFRIISAAATDAIVLVDDTGKISYSNQAAERMFAADIVEIIDNNVNPVLVSMKNLRGSQQVLQEFFAKCGKKALKRSYEFKVVKEDGRNFFIEISTSTLKLKDKNHLLGIIRDITGRKKTEEELVKVRKLESVGVLAGGIAHDFNNILMAILGNLHIAHGLLDNREKARRILKNAEKAALKAKELSQQLLTFSKGGEPIKEQASLEKLIRSSADFILSGSKIACRYQIPDDLFLVDIDKGQMSQVIQNLIINAEQAMPMGGTVEISCCNISESRAESIPGLGQGDYVRIQIQDSGTGIPEEIIGQIFDPYFSTKQNGSGLGLAITHSIIAKHNGHISVHSSNDSGSTFTIYLPADKNGRLEEQKKSAKVVQGSKKVILMDDEEMIRESVGELLESIGHTVLTAADGREAVNIYENEMNEGDPVDIVIVDLTVPGGMGGKETARAILDIDRDAKIIVSSGYSNDPIMARHQEHGFKAAMAKPFDPDELGETITTVLS